MTETVQQSTITKEVVTGTMNIALTKAEVGIQTLSNIEASLTYNEDHLSSIKDFLDKARKAKKVIEDTHKAIKEPVLRQSQIIDESKRNMIEQVDLVMKNPSEKYASICRDIEERKRKAEEERKRIQQAKGSIDYMMMYFSQEIANCKTDKELLAVERLINLEKANKKKYQEFLDEAIEKFNSLTSLLKLQKESIREMNRLEEERIAAEKAGNDAKLLEIHDQQVNLEAKIDENKVTVQETAVNQSMNTNQVIEPKEILPEIKTRRTSWDWEVVNIQETAKKMPAWTEIKPIDEKIDEFLTASKEGWKEAGKEEIIVNGIKFYLKKTY